LPTLALRRRLSWLEIPLLLLGLGLFYIIADKKEIEYSVAVLIGIGALALSFLRPRWGLIILLLLLFTESTLNTINSLADTALENDLPGMPHVAQTQWVAWGVLIFYSVLLLSYLCTSFLKDEKPRPLTALEWMLLLPLIMVLFYLPISMINGYTMMDYTMDILPMCILAGIVCISRVFSYEKDQREVRYFFLDWFIIFNILILVPLWAYNIATNPWRSGYVGIAAVRYGTGPYDFNFFLVPILGMILTYDDFLTKNRRRFYQFAFFMSLLRVVVSLFRGAMAGTLIAIIFASFLVDSARRWKWVRSLLVFLTVIALITTVVVTTVPAAHAVFNVALVRRLKLALNAGSGAGSLEFRELETNVAMQDIAKDPIIGYGPGAKITKHFDPQNFSRVELYLHSGYVWYLYKMGVLGIGVVIAFFIGIYGTCINLLRRALHPPDRGWVIGTFAAMIAMLPVIHTNNMLIRSQGPYAMTLLLFGLCMIALKYKGIPRDQLPPVNGEAH
jgi:hypothetical protein